MESPGACTLGAAQKAQLDPQPREVLLLELSIDLSKLLQFAGSLFRAIRMNSNHAHHRIKDNPAHVHSDVSWMAELLHEVQFLTDPIARGEYGRAGRAAASLSHGLATLTGLREDGLPLGHPWAPERMEVQGMLRRWGREFEPALPESVDALERLAQICFALEATYA